MKTVGIIWICIGALSILPMTCSSLSSMSYNFQHRGTDFVPQPVGDLGLIVILFFFFFLFPGLILYGLGKRRKKDA